MSRIGWERIEDLELKEEEDVGIRNRLIFLRILIIFVLAVLVYRVWWIQQTRGSELFGLAEENRFADLLTDAPRGVIFDRNGEALAINQSSFNVTINELASNYMRIDDITFSPEIAYENQTINISIIFDSVTQLDAMNVVVNDSSYLYNLTKSDFSGDTATSGPLSNAIVYTLFSNTSVVGTYTINVFMNNTAATSNTTTETFDVNVPRDAGTYEVTVEVTDPNAEQFGLKVTASLTISPSHFVLIMDNIVIDVGDPLPQTIPMRSSGRIEGDYTEYIPIGQLFYPLPDNTVPGIHEMCPAMTLPNNYTNWCWLE